MHLLQVTPLLIWTTFFFSFRVSSTIQSLLSDITSDIFGSPYAIAADSINPATTPADVRSQASDSAEDTIPITEKSVEKHTAAETFPITEKSVEKHTAAETFPITEQPVQKHMTTSTTTGFEYGKEKIRGVNIGGWLLTESWLTPTLYRTGNSKIVDEYTFCQYLGREEATRRLRAHWDSFYNESDFRAIKSYGLNHVRIPIGYWAFDISDGEPYVQGQYEYLKQAVEWSRRSGLKVMIDLHGAPGSQNGFDNSGRKGPINWPNDPKNILRTKQILAQITKEFSQPQYAGTVTSLEALNEPAGFANDGGKTLNTAKQYYHDAYPIVRTPNNAGVQSDLLYVVHDSFQPIETWSNSFPQPKYTGVALDTHIYTIFDKISIEKSDDERVATYCRMADSLERSNAAILTFVGEFAPSPTDCANSINHQPSGSRYDGTYVGFKPIGSCVGKSGSRDTFSEEYKLSLGRLFEVQTTVYEKASGWIMWTFKAENADDGSYDAGVKGGWIPKDPTFKAHGNQCK